MLPSIRDSMFTLRNIIGSKAVLSTVINQINNEVVNENVIINELTTYKHNIPSDIFYAILFVGTIYIEYKYFAYFDKKLSGVQTVSSIQEKTRTVLFIFMLVFTKNIQNAI
jgi:hypothetical protein